MTEQVLVRIVNMPGLITVGEVTTPGGHEVRVYGEPTDIEVTYIDGTKETFKGVSGKLTVSKRIARVKVLDNSRNFVIEVVRYV